MLYDCSEVAAKPMPFQQPSLFGIAVVHFVEVGGAQPSLIMHAVSEQRYNTKEQYQMQ